MTRVGPSESRGHNKSFPKRHSCMMISGGRRCTEGGMGESCRACIRNVYARIGKRLWWMTRPLKERQDTECSCEYENEPATGSNKSSILSTTLEFVHYAKDASPPPITT
jgi:hypothetical protein